MSTRTEPIEPKPVDWFRDAQRLAALPRPLFPFHVPTVAVRIGRPSEPPKPDVERYPALASLGFVFPDAFETTSPAGIITRRSCPTCGGRLQRREASEHRFVTEYECTFVDEDEPRSRW